MAKSDDSRQTVKIHGKDYETVASRLNRFIAICLAEKHCYQIDSDIKMELGTCLVKTTITVSLDGVILRKVTGHAHEKEAGSQINKTSFIENAETSAVGRALAFLGYGGTDVRSADEMSQAVHDQEVNKFTAKDKKKIEMDVAQFRDDQVEDFECPQNGTKWAGLTIKQIAACETDTGVATGMGYIQFVIDNEMISEEGYAFQRACLRYYEENFSA